MKIMLLFINRNHQQGQNKVSIEKKLESNSRFLSMVVIDVEACIYFLWIFFIKLYHCLSLDARIESLDKWHSARAELLKMQNITDQQEIIDIIDFVTLSLLWHTFILKNKKITLCNFLLKNLSMHACISSDKELREGEIGG